MKALHAIGAVLVLLSLSASGCGERSENGEQPGAAGSELSQNATTLHSEQELAPQASTAREIPGSQDAVGVTKRSLLDQTNANADLETFASLLRTANMVKNLSGTGPYTVFAPSEEAFNRMSGDTLASLKKPENREQLQALLHNHIIAGKLTTHDLQDGAMLKTAAGHQLKVSKQNGQVRINGALVEVPDEMSSNGVLHKIDQVLMLSEEQ